MTAMKPVLDLVIDANVVLVLAFCLWWVAQTAVVRSKLKTDYSLQLRLLRSVLVFVIASPLLAHAAVLSGQFFWPEVPVTVSDLAVAAYLNGDIVMPALQFEQLLNSRSQTTDAFFAGKLPWATAIVIAVLAGSVLLLCKTLMTLLRIERIVAESYIWRRTDKVDIRLSDTISVPFATRGLFRRHVVIPSFLLTSPSDMKIVLAHEFEHLRQGDVEWELAFEFLRPVLYFNPVFHFWKQKFGRVRELNCDQSVLERLGISAGDYARCLLQFCGQRPSKRPDVSTFNVAFLRTGSKGRIALERRILALSETRCSASGEPVFLLLAGLLAAGVILSAATVRTPGDWSQDRLTLSTVVNLERLEAINRR